MALPGIDVVTVTELKERHENPAELAVFDDKYLEHKIQDVIDKLSGRVSWVPLIEARLASGALTENLYISTICDAVFRVIRNPEGYRMEQEGAYQYQLDRNVAAGWLYFTADNLIDLIGFNPNDSKGKIGTAHTHRDARPY